MRFRISACVPAVCVWMLATSAAQAATIVVPSGGDFQAALNQAQPGDVITLAPNATYVGNWADDSYGGLASPMYFDATGPQTIRVQVREGGLSIDQIVLGADKYLSVAPGALKNDATILHP
jgi:hypothetical protein